MFWVQKTAALSLMSLYLTLASPVKATDLVMKCLFCNPFIVELGGVPVDITLESNTPVLTLAAPHQPSVTAVAQGTCSQPSCPEIDWLQRILALLQSHNLSNVQLQLVPTHPGSVATHYSDHDSKPFNGAYSSRTQHKVSNLLRLNIVFVYQGKIIRIPLSFSHQSRNSAVHWLWGSVFLNGIYAYFNNTGFLNPLHPQVLELVHLTLQNFFQPEFYAAQHVAESDQLDITVSPWFVNISDSTEIQHGALVVPHVPHSPAKEPISFSMTSGQISYAVTVPSRVDLGRTSPRVSGNVVPASVFPQMNSPIMICSAMTAGVMILSIAVYLMSLGSL